MDFSSIKKGLEGFVERYDSQTYIGSYRETSRSSLLNEGLSTRANSLWKMAEYVIAKYDNSDNSIDRYIEGWKQLASGANNQYLLLEEGINFWGMYDAQGHRLGGEEYILDFFSNKKRGIAVRNQEDNKNIFDLGPLQQIFYGAPGTGKSQEIKEKTEKKAVIRTTFHPDSDYSTFVGAYKPTMDDAVTQVIPVVVDKGISLEPAGTYKEKKIVYKFIPQAFLKAYLGAWKKYAQSQNANQNANSSASSVTVSIKNDSWEIVSVDDECANYTKKSTLVIVDYKRTVQRTWKRISESEDPDNYDVKNDERYDAAVCLWYKENNSIDATPDECWQSIYDYLRNGNQIEYIPGTRQLYVIRLTDDNTVDIFSKNSAKKKTIESYFGEDVSSKNKGSVQYAIANKLHEYSDKFEDAWSELKKNVSGSSFSNTLDPQFLVIEEINRGNCAQIFGDLFQLLDRNKNGFSEYPIEADSDLQQEIERAFKEDKDYKLNGGIDIEGIVERYLSNYGATLSEDVQSGRVLLLPPNLYIWATMNTSDQSLFPIDSAFKRRWEWVYMPITDHRDKDYKIEIDDTMYDWWGFLEKINSVINTVTNSEDKKLGYFFVKTDKIINAKQFVGKVLFYLWNDVFKNYGFDNPIFNKEEKSKYVFSEFFQKDGTPETENIKKFMKNLDETIDKEHPYTEKKIEDTVSTTNNDNPDLFSSQE